MSSETGGFSILGNLSLFAIAGVVIKFWWDVSKEIRRQRVETYERLRKDFDDRKEFFPIFSKLEAHADATLTLAKANTLEERNEAQKAINAADKDLRQIPLPAKMRFAAFIENVALHAKSGTFSYELANYEFGDIARKCWCADSFWEDLNDEGKTQETEPLWAMYKEFVQRTATCNKRLTNNPDDEMKWLNLDNDWLRRLYNWSTTLGSGVYKKIATRNTEAPASSSVSSTSHPGDA